MALSVSGYSMTNTRKGIGGLASGLDTDELVQQMTAMTRSKVAKQLQDRELTIWKRDAYREVGSKITDFNTKYFSYSSSSTNIMSRNFFNVSKANSSSSLVKFTGDAQKARDVMISKIEMASKAYAKGKGQNLDALTEKITSGALRETWKESNIAGQSITISFGAAGAGEIKKTLTVGSDVKFDGSMSASDQIDAVLKDLNKQLGKAGLGKDLQFKKNGTSIELAKIGGIEGDLKITDGSTGLMSALGFYPTETAASGAASLTGSLPTDANMFFLDNKISGSSIYFEMGGTSGAITLKPDFRFSADAMAGDVGKQALELQEAYKKAIEESPALKDKLEATVTPDGLGGFKLGFNKTGTGENFKIIGGSNLEALGLKAAGKDDPAYDSVPATDVTATDMSKLMGQVADKNLGDVLSGSSLSVTLNGITKTITFDPAKKSLYDMVIDPSSGDSAADLVQARAEFEGYLSEQFNKAFGSNRVQVKLDATSGKLDIKAVKDAAGTVDDSAILTINSASKNGILGETGALRIRAGESNRLETNMMLRELAGDLGLKPLITDDQTVKYGLKVNGVEFTFEETATIGDMMSKINSNAETGVQISFSSITNSFNVTAKESGAGRQIKIEDIAVDPSVPTADAPNLAAVLFGEKFDNTDPTNPNYANCSSGKDATVRMSFDGGKTFQDIIRTENSFNIDGMAFEFTGELDAGTDPTDINKYDPAKVVKFDVQNNIDELVTKIKDFVKDYNEILKMMNSKITEKRKDQEDKTTTRYLPLTDEQKKEMSDDEIKTWTENAKKGLMQNDSHFGKIITQMRQAMGDKVKGSEDALYQIGISSAAYAWSDNGILEVDEEKLKTALLENPEKVINMFTTPETGISARMKEVLENTVGTTLVEVNPVTHESVPRGVLIQISGRANSLAPDTSTLSKRIDEMGTQITSWQKRLKAEEDRYYAKFTQLEKYISAMNSQSSWLSQQFSS